MDIAQEIRDELRVGACRFIAVVNQAIGVKPLRVGRATRLLP